MAVALTTDKTALVKWKHLPCINRNGKIAYYKIIVEEVQGNGQESTLDSWMTNVHGSRSSFLLDSLKPNTKYNVHIGAINEVGLGPISSPVSFRTRVGECKRLWIIVLYAL